MKWTKLVKAESEMEDLENFHAMASSELDRIANIVQRLQKIVNNTTTENLRNGDAKKIYDIIKKFNDVAISWDFITELDNLEKNIKSL